MNDELLFTLMEMAVTEMKFTCNRQWVTQRDGVAMGSKLAVIVVNIWLNQFEFRLALTVDNETLDKQLQRNREYSIVVVVKCC